MTARRFVGYRNYPPEHYRAGGYANAPDEAQWEGVQFSDGSVILRWMTAYRSTSVWASLEEMMAVHGHADYGTRLEWLDQPDRWPSHLLDGPGSPVVTEEMRARVRELADQGAYQTVQDAEDDGDQG